MLQVRAFDVVLEPTVPVPDVLVLLHARGDNDDDGEVRPSELEGKIRVRYMTDTTYDFEWNPTLICVFLNTFTMYITQRNLFT